jgi:hypothetical protein
MMDTFLYVLMIFLTAHLSVLFQRRRDGVVMESHVAQSLVAGVLWPVFLPMLLFLFFVEYIHKLYSK